MQSTDDSVVRDSVLVALEGSTCAFCEEGELLQSSFKGNDAVVCDVCGTPGAQVW